MGRKQSLRRHSLQIS